jgi:hypothetical protein
MGKQLTQITPEIQAFIEKQRIFFVATAACDGLVNLSPKGMDSIRVLSPTRVIWLNVTGSGNETAAHLLQNNRITIMFCAFEGKPLILRLYGEGQAYHPYDSEWNEYITHFPAMIGARQIFDIKVNMLQTSCGMAVPFMDYNREREELNQWASKKGEEGIRKYWKERNTESLDSLTTGIMEQNTDS